MSAPRERPVVPAILLHLCCGGGWVFGQDANGDCYRRNVGWPGDRPWQPILPPMGAPAPAAKRRTRRGRKRLG